MTPQIFITLRPEDPVRIKLAQVKISISNCECVPLSELLSNLVILRSSRIAVISKILLEFNEILGLDLFSWIFLKSTTFDHPDALVPPFRSSDDQVYHEMAPIGRYNLEEATSVVFSNYRLPRLHGHSRNKTKKAKDKFSSDSNSKNPA